MHVNRASCIAGHIILVDIYNSVFLNGKKLEPFLRKPTSAISINIECGMEEFICKEFSLHVLGQYEDVCWKARNHKVLELHKLLSVIVEGLEKSTITLFSAKINVQEHTEVENVTQDSAHSRWSVKNESCGEGSQSEEDFEFNSGQFENYNSFKSCDAVARVPERKIPGSLECLTDIDSTTQNKRKANESQDIIHEAFKSAAIAQDNDANYHCNCIDSGS